MKYLAKILILLSLLLFSTQSSAQFVPGNSAVTFGGGIVPGNNSLVDPNTDAIIFWDDSANKLAWLTLGTGCTITGTVLDCTGSGGITNLNGLTAATQAFATGTAGTDFAISSSGSTHTFNIPDAGSAARGLVTTAAQTFAGVKTFSSSPIITGLTTGSLIFQGVTALEQDNANLFWNDTTNSLNIGSQTPTEGRVNITALSTTAPALNLRGAASMNGPLSILESSSGTNLYAIYYDSNGMWQAFGSAIEVPTQLLPSRIRSDVNNTVTAVTKNTTANTSAAAGYRMTTSASSDGLLVLNSATNSTFAGAASLNLINNNSASLGFGTAGTAKAIMNSAGLWKFGSTAAPTASIDIIAGTTSASSAPIKLTSGSLMTSPEKGAIEYLTDKIYFTIETGTARKEITLNDAALTSGRVALTTTNGRLTDNANLTFAPATSSLSTTELVTNRLVGGGSAPTIAAGTGAGTSPTVSITGTDLAGYIDVTTGTLPALSAIVATITFNATYGAAPKTVLLTPANVNSAALNGLGMVYVNQAGITATTFSITAGATALTAATAYKWYYHVIK